jgi:DNA-binding transcriptional MocR family regulator
MIAELIMGPAKGSKTTSGGTKDAQGWNAEGWVRWLEGLRGEYQRRMESMADILNAGKTLVKSGRRNSLTEMTGNLHLSLDPSATQTADEWSVVETAKMYDFVRPLGGMFIWVRFDFASHPLASKVAHPRLSRALWVFWTTPQYRVLVSPGLIFAPTVEIRERDAWQCYRLCFAACPVDEIADISKRFVKAVHAFWKIKTVETIDELLKDDDMVPAGAMDVCDTTGMAVMTGFC